MSFITLCESANEDLLEHIVEEATIKFLIECVDQDQDDLIESLVYCVQCYYNEEEIDNEIFEHVFENFYDFIDAESMIYETVLFEAEIMDDDAFDEEIKRRQENKKQPANNNNEKKNIFKRTLGAIGTGISKITPNFLKRKPADVTQEIKEKTPGKLGKIASAAYTAVRHPGETLGKVKEHFSAENRRKRAVAAYKVAAKHAADTNQDMARWSQDGDNKKSLKEKGQYAITKQMNKFDNWNKTRLGNKVKKLSITTGASKLIQQKNKSK